MKNAFYVIFIICALAAMAYGQDLNGPIIDHDLATRIKELKDRNEYSSEDFDACQITWTVKKLDTADEDSKFHPHAITFKYENKDIITIINKQDGDADSIKGLGLNCLEFNNYVYLFFDTLDYKIRLKFGLEDLSYVIFSADQGNTWSPLLSLHPFSVKAKFNLPHNQFRKYLKVFGNKSTHALAIFNLRDETTYLFDPQFHILKTVPVYNRLSDFDDPTDFYNYKNTLYLVRGSCELVRGNIQCPARTYIETSRDFGLTWKREIFPLIKKSYFLTWDNDLYHFYFKPCVNNWWNPIPAWDRSPVCGHLQVRKLNILGQWEKPKTLLKSVAALIGIYQNTMPVLVWKDFRFHRSRSCGYIPLIGCIDGTPFQGPEVVYAGTLDLSNGSIKESLIKYKR
jgi:hypothetical protein